MAHHGFDTEYDANKKLETSGVVSRIEWTNPHMHIYIDVTEENGAVTNYNMEMSRHWLTVYLHQMACLMWVMFL